KIVLGLRIALVGSETKPLSRLGVVLRHAVAFGIHDSEIESGRDIPLARGSVEPLDCCAVVPRHATASVIAKTEQRLAAGVALIGQWLRELERGFVVAFLIGG